MSNLGVVVVGFDFVEFVCFDIFYSYFVGFGVVFDGNLGSYVIYGVDIVFVVSLDEEFDVGVYEGNGYGDG